MLKQRPDIVWSHILAIGVHWKLTMTADGIYQAITPTRVVYKHMRQSFDVTDGNMRV